MKRLYFAFWTIVFLFVCMPFALQAQNPIDAAAQLELTGRTLQPDGLRGEYLTFTMRNPRTYPGTERMIKVYVPKEYDGKQAACTAIMMDDIMYGLAQSIDTLIASGEMPVTIAVGVRPGRIYDNLPVSGSAAAQNPSASQNREVIRYNRSNEFDRCDGRFASFLAEEVLPAVSSFSTGDGLPILLSRSADDRMVLGASSGAIAAFTAAWFRPDLFSRVYSIIGTFVPMRGGDHYPGLIRKTEPQRLRIYLQDNDEDTWNPLFGSWYEYNLLMESALRFAGYELEHHWDKGGHNGRNGGAIMSEALRFLWKDYPSPVKKGKSGNATLNSIIDSSSVWTLVASNVPAGVFIKSAGGACGDDTGLAASVSKAYGIQDNGSGFALPQLLGVGENGFDPYVAVYPGGKHRAIADVDSQWVSNEVIAGSADNMAYESGQYRQEFYKLHTNGGQICFDTSGYLYCATEIGVQICDHNGRVRVILPAPCGSAVSSVGLVGNVLYVISGGDLYARKVQRNGLGNALSVSAPDSDGQG
ncbi:MAG: hypothetical protein MJY76_00585 [Bacteroidales bacterium]|nr:hypothetical protein [Bacteroidales bacterium]